MAKGVKKKMKEVKKTTIHYLKHKYDPEPHTDFNNKKSKKKIKK